jgi:MerR family copper efflux transcriptional regulator
MDNLTIGRLADRAGLHVETIRYYEKRGLLASPRRSHAGYRLYDDADVWRLDFIARAKRLGFTLGEIHDLFGEGHSRSPEEVLDAAHAKLARVDEQMRALTAQRCQLRRLVEVCRHGDDEACLALDADGAR